MQKSKNSPPVASQESDDSGIVRQLQSELSPRPLALPHNFLSSSAHHINRANAPAALDDSFPPPFRNPSGGGTAEDTSYSDQMHSLPSSRFDSQPFANSRDMNPHQNSAQNDGLSGLSSLPLQNFHSMSEARVQINDNYSGNISMANQTFRQDDGATSLRVSNFPSHDLNDVSSTNQVNQGRLTGNSASSGFSEYQRNISDYQRFFGTSNGPQNPTLQPSNINFLGAGFPFPTSQSSVNPEFLGQQGPHGFQIGNLPMQNNMAFSNSMSVASSQGALANSMRWQNTRTNSWQQQQQQLQQDVSLEARPVQMPPEITRKGRGRSSTFPLKLHQMLIDLEKEAGGSAIASFLPHGRGFHIHQPKEFCK